MERAAIETLLSMAVESDATQGATTATDDGAATSKEFAVDNGIDTNRSHASNRVPQIDEQVQCGIVPDRKNMLWLHERKQIEHLPVSGKQEHVESRVGIPFLQATKHRL
jgi:hypothetical protein